jgi:transposase-like protein
VTHIIDAVLDSLSNLFRSHRYPPLEKIYSVILFIAGLSLRDLSERLYLTGASRESVRIWVHKFSSLFRPSRRVRRLVAVDETVLKLKGQICYLGMTYFHETFGNRNRIERWFREMKERTKRFYNNVNAKTLKCIEELVTAIAIMHNIIRARGEEVIPT